MIICSLIFEELNKFDFSDTARHSILSLLCTTIESTDEFMIERIDKEISHYILDYYIEKQYYIENTETKLLQAFLSHISKYKVREITYFKMVSLLLSMSMHRVKETDKIIKYLHAKNKYALLYAMSLEKDRLEKKGTKYSVNIIRIVQEVFEK